MTLPPSEASSDASAVEERILRTWTPVLLRGILATSITLIVTGLVSMAVRVPGDYVEHYERVKAGHLHQREHVLDLLAGAAHGDPYALLATGLFVLTLVPLARVVFCFLLFVKMRDLTYVLFTAYVLLGLAVGIVLGQV